MCLQCSQTNPGRFNLIKTQVFILFFKMIYEFVGSVCWVCWVWTFKCVWGENGPINFFFPHAGL